MPRITELKDAPVQITADEREEKLAEMEAAVDAQAAPPQLPSVGRIVLYSLTHYDVTRSHAGMAAPGELAPAVVTKVWGTGPYSSLGLIVFPHSGQPVSVQSALPGFTGHPPTDYGYWFWPVRT